ncbi:MAG: SGNH/GDSL hydrolase family protein [Clostridia bacterium]|nr:SGNH/GDSL hydrolase family protein [Clostridia bacterium]
MLLQDGDRIVFAGDSVTDMGSTKPVGEGVFDGLGKGYVRIVDSLLAAFYPERRIRVTNSGLDGNSSKELLTRFHRDVVSLDADWVAICIGINDVWRQFDVPAITSMHVAPTEYRANLEQMITAVKGKVKGVFLLSPYYVEPNRADPMRARMDEYVAICRELSQRHGCIFVNLQEMFEEYCEFRHSSSVAWDRVHPNQVGSTLIAKAFLEACEFEYHHIPV